MVIKKNDKRLKINGNILLIDDYSATIGKIDEENSGDIFLINDYYVSKDLLRYDYRDGFYKDREKVKIKGVISLKAPGNNPKFGFFSKLPFGKDFSDYLYNSGEIVELMTNDIIEGNKNYRRSPSDGAFYDIRKVKAIKILKGNINLIKKKYPYSSGEKIEEGLKYLEKNFNKKNYDSIDNIENIMRIIDGKSFGFEFETVRGFLAKKECKINGLIPLRDGSINGLEYATVPLSGERGIQVLTKAVSLLKEKTRFDDSCSLHLHVGGVKRTESFIVAFIKMVLILQDEYFEMFPISKKYNKRIKRKGYTKPFPTISLLNDMDKKITPSRVNRNFNVINKWLVNDFLAPSVKIDDILFHPRDLHNDRKWNIDMRYYFINVIPLIYGNKQTIEFRIHNPTFNINKIINFLLLNILLIKFIEKNEKNILENVDKFISFRLSDVIFDFIEESSMGETGFSGDNSLLRYIETNISYRKIEMDRQYKEKNKKYIESEVEVRDIIGIKSGKQLSKKILNTFETSAHKIMGEQFFSVFEKEHSKNKQKQDSNIYDIVVENNSKVKKSNTVKESIKKVYYGNFQKKRSNWDYAILSLKEDPKEF